MVFNSRASSLKEISEVYSSERIMIIERKSEIPGRKIDKENPNKWVNLNKH